MTTPIPQALADLNRQVQELKAENARLREIERLYNEAAGQEPVAYRYRVQTAYGTAITFRPGGLQVLDTQPLYAAPGPQAPAVAVPEVIEVPTRYKGDSIAAYIAGFKAGAAPKREGV